MSVYLKQFFHRGLLFGGFGPIVMGIVYVVLAHTVPDFSLTGEQVCLSIVSTYLLAFVQAGASVFNQIEHWSISRSLFCHLGLLYLTYVTCYLANTWIPFEPMVIVIFTGVFVAVYAAVWLTVFLITRSVTRKCNEKLK